jgi:hypothetical protein
MNNDTPAGKGCGYMKTLAAVVMVLLGILTAAEVAQAWTAWQRESGQFGRIGSVAQGALCAVTLASGSVYYGTLIEAESGYVQLANVYYVQNVSQPNGAAPQFNLVNRQKNDWHGPDWMTIPVDKILFVENVGIQSKLSNLINQDRSAAAGAH